MIENQYPILKVINSESLTKEFGSPLYVYHAETIARQYNRLTSAFGNVDLKIKYACKALTNLAIMNTCVRLEQD